MLEEDVGTDDSPNLTFRVIEELSKDQIYMAFSRPKPLEQRVMQLLSRPGYIFNSQQICLTTSGEIYTRLYAFKEIKRHDPSRDTCDIDCTSRIKNSAYVEIFKQSLNEYGVFCMDTNVMLEAVRKMDFYERRELWHAVEPALAMESRFMARKESEGEEAYSALKQLHSNPVGSYLLHIANDDEHYGVYESFFTPEEFLACSENVLHDKEPSVAKVPVNPLPVSPSDAGSNVSDK